MKSKGFTLIELLVVIAIIGVLAAVVLASLLSARTRGQAAAVQSQLANMRAQAQLFYSTNGNDYGTEVAAATCPSGATLFDSANHGLGALITGVNSIVGSANTNCVTYSATGGNASAWAVAAVNPANTANSFCVDSTGFSKESVNMTPGDAISATANCN